MKKYLVLFLLVLATPVYAQIPTTDGVAAAQRQANQTATLAQMAAQLMELKAQLQQARTTYESVTGSREFGMVAYSQAIKYALPDDMVDMYNSAESSLTGISGSVAQIIDNEKLNGNVSEVQSKIRQRQRLMAATDKAVGISAYNGAKARLAQIEALMGKINTTQDPKGIAELQARIQVEQAAIGNEQAKLAVMQKMQASEAALLEQQKVDLNQRILSTENQGMPGIK